MLHVILIYFIGLFLSSPSNKPDLPPIPPIPNPTSPIWKIICFSSDDTPKVCHFRINGLL